MKPENQEPEVAKNSDTTGGETVAGLASVDASNSADMEAQTGAAEDKESRLADFAEAGALAASEQKLKVGADEGANQIAILPAQTQEVSEPAAMADQGKSTPPLPNSGLSAAGLKSDSAGDHKVAGGWVPGFNSGWPGVNPRDSRVRQLFNAFYFGLTGLSAISLVSVYSSQLPVWAMAWISPIGLTLWGVFVALALCACFFAIHNRPHESDFKVDLQPHVRRRIRRLGLLLPLPVIVLAGCVNLSQHELAIAQHRIDDGHYKRAARHLGLAIALNPLSEEALAQMALCQNWLDAYGPALHYANMALTLNPNDGRAMEDKAWSLNRLERFPEALVAAQNAVRLNPENGEAFRSLADAFVGVGDNEAALVAATRHAQLHDREAAAYEQLGDIYDRLGQIDEANLNRDEARALQSAADQD